MIDIFPMYLHEYHKNISKGNKKNIITFLNKHVNENNIDQYEHAILYIKNVTYKMCEKYITKYPDNLCNVPFGIHKMLLKIKTK